VIYKISYVVGDDSSPGIIKVQDQQPQVGDSVAIGNRTFQVLEVTQMIPPKNDEVFLLVTLVEQAPN